MVGGSKRLNLALQGGGAHGAFTWGVLDRLLEGAEVEPAWISGTSAGAVNAIAMIDGLQRSGRDGARQALRSVWEAVEAAAASDLARLNPFLYGMTKASGLAGMAGLVSPYDFNPLGLDPLRQLLSQRIDFEAIRRGTGPELLIAATDVGTGRARLFRRGDISLEAVLASACLPHIHHAVEIDGRTYWDGGFSANPDLVTLAADSPCADTLLVQLNAQERMVVPRSARDIAAHVATITFNQPLLRDIAVIAAAQAEPRRRWWLGRGGRLSRIGRHRLHVIDAGIHTAALSAHSKAMPEKATLAQLFEAGRMEAQRWLAGPAADVGRRQGIDLSARYLAPPTKPMRQRPADAGLAAGGHASDEPRL